MTVLHVPSASTPGLSAAVRAKGAPTPGAPEPDEVRAMFDRIAPRYDLLNRVLSAGIDVRWRRRCVRSLDLAPGARVLDVCTGTADLLVEVLHGAPARSGAGVDLSGAMLLVGAAKLARAGGRTRVALARGDAQRLPVASGAFDAAMVAFGIRNVGEPLAALREVRRALRPGGRLAVLEFSMPKGPLGLAYRAYFRRVLPLIGRWVSGDGGAYAYLPESVARWPAPSDFGALMAEAGFFGVRWTSLTGGIAHLYRGDLPE